MKAALRAIAAAEDIPVPADVIGEGDEMYGGNLDHYMGVGLSAMRSILPALRMAGSARCARILDLPCGHGRVLRWLRARFPEAVITACDLNRAGVDWCAATYGAQPVYSVPDLSVLDLGGNYDLIWCGSLLTHLDAAGWMRFLAFFEQQLAPGGVLVFSSHGRQCAEWVQVGRFDYGLKAEVIPQLLADYRSLGFAYQNYWHSTEYGISLATPQWVLGYLQTRAQLRVLGYSEVAWDGHHDVIACQRRAVALAAGACPPAPGPGAGPEPAATPARRSRLPFLR